MKRTIVILAGILVYLCFIGLLLHLVMFPEQYISTWKYQLENEVKAGETEMVEYYQTVYLSRGIELFEM